MAKGTKRRKQLAQKKARKAERFKPARNGVGNSAYAMKKRAQARGNYSPGSPFRHIEED